LVAKGREEIIAARNSQESWGTKEVSIVKGAAELLISKIGEELGKVPNKQPLLCKGRRTQSA